VPQCEIYYNEDTSYGVYTFCTKEPLPDAKEYFSNQFDALYDPENPKLYSSQLAGSMQRLYVGAEYNITAEPIYNKKYGAHQFKPNSVLAITPKTVNEQKAFLQAIVTRNQADALLMAYPNIVEDVINKRDNVDLSKVKGVGNKSWKTIRDKIVSNYVISDILVMLQPLGVTYNVINKLVMSENNPSLLKHKLVDNPYMMTKIRGLGFKKVDDLALKLNPKLRQSTKRAYAYIRYYLHSVAENDGHTWVLINNLRAGAKENIPECSEEFAKIIEDEHKSEMILHFQDKIVGLKRYYESEMACLNILEELNAQPYPEIPRDVINNGIKKAEEQQGFSYTEEQKATIIKALHSNVAVICGAAGTGKSTIARGIIDSYKEYGKSISCCALSARAALRISEAAGHPASTIHRLLGIDKKTGCFMCNANNPIQADVIFLDEASMVNLDIFEALLVAIKFGSRVIICGDNAHQGSASG
jgi:exodeoxyribonuclease V alpha subunit